MHVPLERVVAVVFLAAEGREEALRSQRQHLACPKTARIGSMASTIPAVEVGMTDCSR
ncbi:MAG: hypothetical protein ACYTG0_14385 [Planctomycetota bacterium]